MERAEVINMYFGAFWSPLESFGALWSLSEPFIMGFRSAMFETSLLSLDWATRVGKYALPLPRGAPPKQTL
jgi:hypothetical protein